MGPGLIEILLLSSLFLVAIAMLAVGVAWGIRWGLKWVLKDISKDPEIEENLKRIFNQSEE